MDLTEKIRQSIEAFKNLPREEQDRLREEQRRSWARGEAGMGTDRDEARYREALRKDDRLALAVLEGESLARMRRLPK
jgi:Spy/CpxP family protein refolding chaperone